MEAVIPTPEERIEIEANVIKNLPVCIPAKGMIVGFANINIDKAREHRLYDNFHYPLGTSYLTRGVLGVAEKAKENAEKYPDNKEFFLGIERVYREISDFIARHQYPLEEMLKVADSKSEIERLERILTNIRVLAKGKPQTLEQAVQLIWFMYRIRSINRGSCIGRLDVRLGSFYKNDIKNGMTTEEKAFDLICELWERINETGSGDTLINVMVGGKNADGSDASNDLSVLMLKASRKVRKTEPHINVRYHKNIRPDLMEEAYRVQLMGHGQAAVYNDDVIIPNLLAHGISEECAYNYTNDGCTEITFDGMSDIHFNHLDVVSTFELALNNGKKTPKNKKPVPYVSKDHKAKEYMASVKEDYKSGETDSLNDFEEFFEIFMDQYGYQITDKCMSLHRQCMRRGGNEPPYALQGTFENVLNTGKPMMKGGMNTTCYMLFLGSIPTAADCLAAIKENVFDKKRYTIPQIKEALAANFEGYEVMRAHLLASPKFGNDDDYVDLISARIVDRAIDIMDKLSSEYGMYFAPALVGWRFIQEAHDVGATPDGRKYTDPIAEHYCPTPGRAINGPTAIINSVTKAPLYRAGGVAATHISLPMSLTKNEESGLALLRAIHIAAFERGIVMMATAFYDAELLRKAQCNPEQYPDLIVRVWGFSARFIDLCKEMQDHVISRVSQ